MLAERTGKARRRGRVWPEGWGFFRRLAVSLGVGVVAVVLLFFLIDPLHIVRPIYTNPIVEYYDFQPPVLGPETLQPWYPHGVP